MRKKWFRGTIALLILVGAAAAIAATAGERAKRESGPRVLPVTTVTVAPVTSYRTRRTYTGTIVPARVADLSWERAGEITAIHVDQGDTVEPGDVLATLNTNRLAARRRELTAQLAGAHAMLDELNTGARLEAIAAARAEVSNFESQVKLQQLTLQRRETLLGQRAVSKADYDQATYGFQSAEALLEVARQKLAELEAGPRVEKKRAQQAAIQQLEASIAAVDADLEDSQLVAPFGGTITSRLLDEGSVATPVQVALRLIEDRHLEAWFGVPLSAARQLQEGAQCRVRIDQRELTAQIKAVIPELDAATRTQRIVMTLSDDPASPVFPGEVVRLDVESETRTETSFWLPTTALVQGSRGLWVCYAIAADAALDAQADRHSLIEKRDLKIVHTAGERVLVRGMLQAGDNIVADGAHRVVPGQSVQITSVP